jgi:hypothetical protein
MATQNFSLLCCQSYLAKPNKRRINLAVIIRFRQILAKRGCPNQNSEITVYVLNTQRRMT